MQWKSSNSFRLVLNGGLGNQLFGYAAGKSIERETGLVCNFIRPGAGDRSYELDNFGVRAKAGNSIRFHPLSKTLMYRLANKFDPDKFRFHETSFTFDHRFYANPAGKTLFGYFQSYRYLENIKSELLNLPSCHVPFSRN